MPQRATCADRLSGLTPNPYHLVLNLWIQVPAEIKADTEGLGFPYCDKLLTDWGSPEKLHERASHIALWVYDIASWGSRGLQKYPPLCVRTLGVSCPMEGARCIQWMEESAWMIGLTGANLIDVALDGEPHPLRAPPDLVTANVPPE